MNYIVKTFCLILFCITCFIFWGCKKIIEIPPPISSITTSEVFSNDQQAIAAMSGIYYNMVNSYIPTVSSGGLTIYGGLCSDEFMLFNTSNSEAFQFFNNNLLSTNNIVNSNLWSPAFSTIYQVNALLEGVDKSTSISDSVKNELVGEAKFIRGLLNFYLVNLFGDIPKVTTTNWRKTSLQPRAPASDIYDLIVEDMQDAYNKLPMSYTIGNGYKIVPNKFAAAAFLAKVYLFQNQWQKAYEESAEVINSNMYRLESDLNEVFSPTSSEAIFQLQQDNTSYTFNGTEEGNVIVPIITPYFVSPPFIYISNTLLNSFENNDKRKSFWISSVDFSGTTYYFPYKYKIGPGEATPNGAYSEYYTSLRLAEQFLIRAEAEAQLGKFPEASNDLDVIRERAGILDYSGPLDKDSLLSAIYHERQIEFFSEWGNRWFDLKRLGIAKQVLSLNKGITVSNNSLLLPIPLAELQSDPNLTQNPGY